MHTKPDKISFLEKIRSKSDVEKKFSALIFAGLITIMILIVWILFFINSLSGTSSQVDGNPVQFEKNSNPVTPVLDQFKNLFN